MKFELKGLKYAAFASEDSHCFEATLYIDGKRFCQVSDDGHGGCTNYFPLKGDLHQNKLYPKIKEINDELKKELLPCSWDENETIENDLEIVVGNLVNEALVLKDIKRQLKKISYIKGDNTAEVFEVKLAPTAENLAKVRNNQWWKSSFKVLNEMPIDEVLKLDFYNAQ